MRLAGRVIDGSAMSDEAIGWVSTGALGVPLRVDAEVDDVNRREALQAAVVATLTSGIAVAGAVGEEVARAAARCPDPTTADHLAGMVQHLRELDDTTPVGSLAPMAGQLAGFAIGLLEAAPERLKPDIGRAAAEAAMVHAWQLVDAGQDGVRAMDRVMTLAIERDAPALVGQLLSVKAEVALASGQLSEAVRLARSARQPRWRLSPGGIACAAMLEVRSCALTGDREGREQAMDVVESGYGSLHRDEEPPWLYWLGGPLDLRRQAMALLGRGPADGAAVEAALAQLPAERRRDLTWYRANMAVAHALAGDVEGATARAEGAARLSRDSGSTSAIADLCLVARRPHLAPPRTVLAEHGLLAA